MARKHVTGTSKQLRVATDEAERYAVVSKMLGNGMCYVRLLDGSTGDRLCIIRNKFKGRGKRDNILDSGSWVLVGMREWASKQDTCDLLEVYNANERDRLIKNEPCFKNVSAEDAANNNNHNNHTNANVASSNVQFTDSTTLKYNKMVNKDAVKDAATDSDDEVPMQQRVYDMPTSDEDEDDHEDDDQEDDDQEDEDDDEVPVPVTKPNSKMPQFAEINVDDI